MEVICERRRKDAGDACDKRTRLLDIGGCNRRITQRVPGQYPANIHLIGGWICIFVNAVTAEEAPVGAEIMIDSDHAKIVRQREYEVAIVAAGIQPVIAGIKRVAGRLVFVPNTAHQRIDADSARVARLSSSRTASGRSRKVVLNRVAICIQFRNNALAQSGGRHQCGKRPRARIALAFVVHVEVCLATQNLLRQRSTQSAAEAVEMRLGLGNAAKVVVPVIGIQPIALEKVIR